MRAVRGVGALIWDFLGVSVVFDLLARLDAVDKRALAVAEDGVEIFERFPAVMKGCRIAFWGLMRRSGSHTRHLETKSTKSSSSQRRTWDRLFVPGLLLRPFEFTTGRGAPVESKKSRLRELRLTKSLSGRPRTSIIQDNCSCSFSPGKMGNPVFNSARMQPKLHISMAMW